MSIRWVVAALTLMLSTYSHGAYAFGDCDKVDETRIERVSRVFMSRTNEYILIVQTGQKEYAPVRVYVTYSENVRMFADVPAEQQMFATKYTCSGGFLSSSYEQLEIHTHSIAGIEGGGWSTTQNKSTQQGQNHSIE